MKLSASMQPHRDNGNARLLALRSFGRNPRRDERLIELTQIRRDKIGVDRRLAAGRIHPQRTLDLDMTGRGLRRHAANIDRAAAIVVSRVDRAAHRNPVAPAARRQ